MARTSLKSVMKMIDNANSDTPIEQQFLNDLTLSIEHNAEKGYRKPSQTFKPSGMNCARSMVYQVLGVEPDKYRASYQAEGITESGTDRHVRIQQAIESMENCEFVDVGEFIKQRQIEDLEIKEQKGMELKLYHKKYNMSFMCDGILKYKNRYFIFEFKTEVADKYYSRRGVDDSHKNQARAYSVALGLDDVIFVYENRNTLDKKSFLYHVTPEDKGELERTLGYCQSYVAENKIPPKPENVLKKACTYCAYREKCKEDTN